MNELKGIPAIREELERKIEDVYSKEKIQSPGTSRQTLPNPL